MHLIIYGDFNCPFSALASERAFRLETSRAATIEWRAVQHDLEIPPTGQPVQGDLAEELDDELGLVRKQLAYGEEFPIGIPSIRPATGLATERYAATAEQARPETRRRMFHAMWFSDQDLGDANVLDQLGIPQARDDQTSSHWQEQWEALDDRLVPMLLLPDGHTSRGLGALRRLRDLIGATA